MSKLLKGFAWISDTPTNLCIGVSPVSLEHFYATCPIPLPLITVGNYPLPIVNPQWADIFREKCHTLFSFFEWCELCVHTYVPTPTPPHTHLQKQSSLNLNVKLQSDTRKPRNLLLKSLSHTPSPQQ